MNGNYTVEVREGKDWGLTAPLAYDDPRFKEVLEDTLEVAQIAKEDKEPFPKRVQDLIQKYTPWKLNEASIVLPKFGFDSWAELVDFVKDDECIELWIHIAKWAKRNNIPAKKNRDFIKGEGMGVYDRLIHRSMRTIQKTFDQKYFNEKKYKTQRPKELLDKMMDINSECIMNYLHPGHPEDPTGHGAKFGEMYDHAQDVYLLSDAHKIDLRTMLSFASHARSGGPVHWLCSNLKAWALAGVKEAKVYFR